MIAEEGLANVWVRHQNATDTLYKGLESLGIKPFVDYTSTPPPPPLLFLTTEVKSMLISFSFSRRKIVQSHERCSTRRR